MPYLSALAILMLISGAVVLYLVSVRYLIMAWGVNKFARKLIRPHTVPNNEVLDLLSRVPDDEDLVCSTLQWLFLNELKVLKIEQKYFTDVLIVYILFKV